MVNSIVIFICLALDRTYHFWSNLIQKIKIMYFSNHVELSLQNEAYVKKVSLKR